ncbi:MAG: hypothetical protein GY716_23620 [bacterium]|nr:hypothetical protein [bacterium]
MNDQRNHSLVRRIAYGALVSAVGCAVVLGIRAGRPAHDGARAIACAGGELEAAHHAAAGYLNRVAKPDGSFVYRVNPGAAAEPKRRYNMLRHAGAIYALSSYERRYPSASTQDTLRAASDFLVREAIGPIEGHDDLLAVWTRPEQVGGSKRLRAKLGGAGLALVALLGAREVGASSVPPETLNALGRFILFMQKPDGSLYSLYVPAEGGRSDSWTSLYYPGEAALGLVLLDELDPNPAWIDGATRALAWLARSRDGAEQVPADHWALLATARLLPRLDPGTSERTRLALIRHAEQVSESILDVLPSTDAARLEHTGFVDDGRTCPTATRLEGLLAALSFLPDEHEALRRRIAAAVGPGIAFLMRAQLNDGEHAGGIPRAIRRLDREPAHDHARFNERAGEIRIDYVQHTLSAMLAVERSPRACRGE